MPQQFDYIIAGAGCAGLSLAMHMIHSGTFTNKKILIVDKDSKRSNDRTWCFWEKEAGLFEPVVFRQWDRLQFHSNSFSNSFSISPYRYKMIRGLDFYNYCFETIKTQKNFTVWKDEVSHVFSNKKATGVVINGKAYLSDYVFNSLLFAKPSLRKDQFWLWQHFKGWIIESGSNVFDPSQATLMDFRVSQENGTAFCYVLPISSSKALVEFTLFSSALLKNEEYDEGLKDYIEKTLSIKDYNVVDEEMGKIPMTNFRFSPGSRKLVNIGTAGGQTKGSSGYTFRFIQKHSAAIVKALEFKKDPVKRSGTGRFHFYDSVLLNILHHNTVPGDYIFTQLFQKNKAVQVLKFLDNETGIKEELKIISSLPTMPFLKAGIKEIT